MGSFKSENIPAKGANFLVVPLKLIENWSISSILVQVCQFIPVHNNALGVHCPISEWCH